MGKIPWRREWLPTPVFLPGESHGQRSLVDYSPWGSKESDKNKRLSFSFSLFFFSSHYKTFPFSCLPESIMVANVRMASFVLIQKVFLNFCRFPRGSKMRFLLLFAAAFSQVWRCLLSGQLAAFALSPSVIYSQFCFWISFLVSTFWVPFWVPGHFFSSPLVL